MDSSMESVASAMKMPQMALSTRQYGAQQGDWTGDIVIFIIFIHRRYSKAGKCPNIGPNDCFLAFSFSRCFAPVESSPNSLLL